MTLRLVPGWNGLTEPEAVSYVAAVEAADGEPLEFGVAKAINDFVLGCKNDGIWSAIKASCILAGARTLDGALVPLVGTAPTNYNFVAGDYDRETGLVGDGSTKYLDSNRNHSADPQDDQHFFCNLSVAPTGNMAVIGAGGAGTGTSHITFDSGIASYRSRSSSTGLSATTHSVGGFGASRSSSDSFFYLSSPGVVSTAIAPSQTPVAGSIHVFRRNAPSSLDADSRITFYSIGESLDLALLNTRVSALITAIGVAIP